MTMTSVSMGQPEMTTASDSDTAQLLQLFGHMLEPDTATVTAATKLLNKILKKPEIVPVLMRILCTPQYGDTIRQLSVVVLRKRISKHWPRLSPEARAAVQTSLLSHVAGEPSSAVRRAVAEAVGAIARVVLPVGGWPELIPFVHQLTTSQSAEHREAALKLFGVVTDAILGPDRRQRAAMKPVVFRVISDALGQQANPLFVKLAALDAARSLVKFLETERDIVDFRDGVLPNVIAVVRQCIAEELIDSISAGFELFEDLMEIDVKAVATCIAPIVQVSLEVAANKELEFMTRQIAVTFVEWVTRFKPSFAKKNNLIAPFLGVLFPMCAEPDGETAPAPDGDDDDATTPHTYAAEEIELLSDSMPSRVVYAAAAPLISQYVQSTDPHRNRAGLAAIAVLAENCAEAMKEHLQGIVSVVIGATASPHKFVREAACVAMAQMSEHLLPEIVEYHAQIIPCVFAVMADTDPLIQRKSSLVFEVFAVSLREKIIPYMPQLMERLLYLVIHGPLDVRDSVVSGIASIVESSLTAFAPYVPATLAVVKPLSAIQGEREALIRGRAIECLGAIARVIGKQAFAPHVVEAMTNAIEGMTATHAYSFDYNEMCFGFFANIAETFGADFAPFLEAVMAHVTYMIQTTELGPGSDSGQAGDGEDDGEVKSDDEGDIEIGDDDDEEEESDMKLHEAFFECKAAACRCAGSLAKELKALFAPFVQRTTAALLENLGYPQAEIRASAIFGVTLMIDAAAAALPTPGGMHPSTKTLVDALMKAIIESVKGDPSTIVVETALDGISHLCQVVGQPAITPYYEQITSLLHMLLERKTTCQVAPQDDDEEDDGGGAVEGGGQAEDKEIDVFETVGEVIVELAKVYGQSMVPFFMAVIGKFANLMRRDNVHYFRSLGMATITEVIRITRMDPTPILQPAFDLFVRGISDPDETVRHNSCFCVGILLSNAGANGNRLHIEAAKLLGPSLQLPVETTPNIRDNAVGALARMLVVPGSPLPLDQAVPVLLAGLPLQSDKEEYGPVIDALAALMGGPAIDKIAPSMPQVFQVIAHAATWAGETPLVATSLGGMSTVLKRLFAQFENQFKQLCASLPTDQQAAIAKLLL